MNQYATELLFDRSKKGSQLCYLAVSFERDLIVPVEHIKQ